MQTAARGDVGRALAFHRAGVSLQNSTSLLINPTIEFSDPTGQRRAPSLPARVPYINGSLGRAAGQRGREASQWRRLEDLVVCEGGGEDGSYLLPFALADFVLAYLAAL